MPASDLEFSDNAASNWLTQIRADPDIWTPRRQRLRDWFQEQAPGLAPAYVGAVCLLQMQSLPALSHFVCHVARDIINKLPEILGAKVQRGDAYDRYKQAVSAVDKAWVRRSDEFSGLQSTEHNDQVCVSISVSAHCSVDALLKFHGEIKGRSTTEDLLKDRLFGERHRRYPGLVSRLHKDFGDLRKWFTGHVHLGGATENVCDLDELRAKFESMEGALYLCVTEFFEGTEVLDAILQETNQRAD